MGTETPVIILTSYNWDEIADEAREAGVDTFVSKPLFAGTVLDEFRDVAANAGAYRATATLDEGYIWADGKAAERSISLTVTLPSALMVRPDCF